MSGAAREKPLALSIVSAGKPVVSSSRADFFCLDRRRAALGLPVARLCALAGIDPRHYWRLKAGSTMGRRAAAKIAGALDGALVPSQPAGLAVLHRLVMAVTALSSGNDPAAAIGTDFAVQRPLDRQWLAAARVRRIAMYVLVREFDHSRADVARALGCTRQNVAQAVEDIELAAEDPDFAALLLRVAGLATGQTA